MGIQESNGGTSDYSPSNDKNNLGQTIPPIDNFDNIPEVNVEVQKTPIVKEPSLPIIGFKLSRLVLWMISGFILLLVIFLFVKDFDATSDMDFPVRGTVADSTFAKNIEVMKMIQEEKKNYRDFTVQISQMILLNLLLPVLTAILGYIFASNQDPES